MEMKPYEVYIKTNENGYVVDINSSAFLTDTSGWVKIDDGYGDKYHHAQGNYFEDGIFEMQYMIPMYKYVDSVVVKRTDEEIQVDIAEIKSSVVETPSQIDIIEAQVTYTAMMTDTLLEV